LKGTLVMHLLFLLQGGGGMRGGRGGREREKREREGKKKKKERGEPAGKREKRTRSKRGKLTKQGPPAPPPATPPHAPPPGGDPPPPSPQGCSPRGSTCSGLGTRRIPLLRARSEPHGPQVARCVHADIPTVAGVSDAGFAFSRSPIDPCQTGRKTNAKAPHEGSGSGP